MLREKSTGLGKALPGRTLLLLGLAALAAVLVRVPFFRWPLTTDEGAYAYTAHWWFRGVPLYSDQLWLDRFQGLFLVYRLGALIFGASTWAIRLWGALWAAATSLAVYALTARLFSRRAGVAAAFLFAVYSGAPHIEGFTTNGEILMVLPATLSALWLLERRAFWAGVAVSAAVMIKPSGGSGFLLAGLWLLYERAPRREWLRFGLGALLPALASLVHGTLESGLYNYLYAVLLFEAGVGWGSHTNLWGEAAQGWLLTSPAWAPLALLSFYGLRRVRGRARAFSLLWLGASLAGVAMGGRWYQHYFTQLMPPLAACAGAAIGLWWQADRALLRVGSLALLAACLAFFESPYLLQAPRDGAWALYHRHGFRIADDVAAYIRAHTQPDETIYVAFAESDIYHLAQRRSAFPLLFYIHVVYYPGAYDRLLSTIEAREPAYVLWLNPPPVEVDPGNRFGQVLERGYEVEKVFERVALYRRRGGEEPAAADSARVVRSPCAPATRPSLAPATPGLTPTPCAPCRR